MLSLLIALSASASAQDCDVRQLKKDLAESNGNTVDEVYVQLAACDPNAAKAAAPAAFAKVLSGEGGNAVVRAAISVGAGEDARTWIAGLQADERSRTIAGLGAACATNEDVAAFLVETSEVLGDRFWTERWYRSLAECRVESIQTVLQAEVESSNPDRTRFFGVLEVYSRNLGKDAIPTLESLLTTVQAEEELTYVVNAFADAAQVGSLNGQDAETTELAVAAIVNAAPTLPPRAVEQARTTLTTLGAQEEADKLAAVRYADVYVDGQLTYGVVVVEVTTCKKGQPWVGVHHGVLIEDGDMWPDQVAEAVDAASAAWTYELAKKCKGTSENTVHITRVPMSAADIEAWTAETVRDANKLEADKQFEYDEETALQL